MAGRFIVCFVAAFALIQPFNSLPAAEHKPHEVIYRNSKGEYYTSDGVILTDQYPIYFRQNAQEPKKDHVVIVEPTVTYTRQAEYTSTQASPATTTFRASQQEGQSNFRPYDGRAETASTVAYYPYYIRAASSSQSDTSNRVVVDVADPSYQRFVPRDQTVRDERGQTSQTSQTGQTYYYYSDGRTQQTSSQAPPPPPPPQPTIASRSSVRFYFPNGTAINTYYTQDNKQVMDIHPNQYLIQVTELTTTTTTPRPTTTDCPPYPHPCNAVVYQQTTQCCKCYLVPSRCCPCNYPNQKK